MVLEVPAPPDLFARPTSEIPLPNGRVGLTGRDPEATAILCGPRPKPETEKALGTMVAAAQGVTILPATDASILPAKDPIEDVGYQRFANAHDRHRSEAIDRREVEREESDW